MDPHHINCTVLSLRSHARSHPCDEHRGKWGCHCRRDAHGEHQPPARVHTRGTSPRRTSRSLRRWGCVALATRTRRPRAWRRATASFHAAYAVWSRRATSRNACRPAFAYLDEPCDHLHACTSRFPGPRRRDTRSVTCRLQAGHSGRRAIRWRVAATLPLD